MQYYELTYLISPELSEEESQKFSENLLLLVQEEGGTLRSEGMRIKKRLAYSIKKNDWAYLATLSFYLDKEKVKSVEDKIKSLGQILRYLFLVKKPVVQKELIRKQVKKPAPAEDQTGAEQASSAEKTKEKVELQEIDKKLEEILDNYELK